MRALIAVLVIGSTLALLALFATDAASDDELARSITQLVERSR